TSPPQPHTSTLALHDTLPISNQANVNTDINNSEDTPIYTAGQKQAGGEHAITGDNQERNQRMRDVEIDNANINNTQQDEVNTNQQRTNDAQQDNVNTNQQRTNDAQQDNVNTNQQRMNNTQQSTGQPITDEIGRAHV